MIRKYCFFIAACFFLSSFCLAFGSSNIYGENGDFEIWNYDHSTQYINAQLWLYMATNFRFGNNASEFYYFHQDLKITWKPFSFFSISPNYRQIFYKDVLEPSLDIWVPIYYPNLDIAFLWDVPYFNFRDRSRIAYATISPKTHLPNSWIYRNKLTIKTRNQYSPLKLRFFADGEIFILEREGFDEYRITGRVSMKFIPKIKFEIGYRVVGVKDINSWIHANVLLLNLKGQF